MPRDADDLTPSHAVRPSHRATVWASIFVPVAAVSIFEVIAAGLTPHGTDRPYAMRCAAVAALFAMTIAASAGLAIALLRLVRTARAAAAIAVGLTVLSSVIFVLANGLPPLMGGARSAGPAVIVAVASAIALAAAIARLALPLPSPPGLAPFLEPPILAGSLVGGYALLTFFGIATGAAHGLALEAGILLLGLTKAAVIVALTKRMARARRSGEGPASAGDVASPHRAVRRLDDVLSDPRARRGLSAAAFASAAIYPTVAIAALLAGRTPFSAVSTVRAGAGKRPDVLLIVMDTTRASALPAPPDARLQTPAAARLASEGTRFTSAFSTSCWTLPAHGSLFTGLAPSEHRATWASEHLSPAVTTLAEQFQRSGWRTAAFSANPWVTPEFGFGRGFDHFATWGPDRTRLRPTALVLGVSGPWSEAAPSFEDTGGLGLASGALRFLGEDDDPRPAFVFLNLMEPHLPYDPPEEALGSLAGTGWDRRALDGLDQERLSDLRPGSARSPREIEGLRLLYGAEVAYDDALVGRILDRLRDAGRLDDTIVLVTADHGENLGDHPPLDHQLGLWDSLIHVPLILRYPARVKAGAVDESLVSLVDVPDALLTLAGVRARGGGPLLGDGRRDAVFFEYDRSPHILKLIRETLKLDPLPWEHDLAGIRTRDAKWIEATDGHHEAFDLAADPGEHHNLAGGGTAPGPAMEALRARLRAAIAARPAHPAPTGAEHPPVMSDEAAEKLRSLGYVR